MTGDEHRSDEENHLDNRHVHPHNFPCTQFYMYNNTN